VRESNLIIATGVKGVGKTYTTLWKEAIPFARGTFTGKQRPVLIFDVNNEYAWTTDTKSNIYPKAKEDRKYTNGRPIRIKAVALNQLALLSKDTTGMVRRFAPFYTDTAKNKKGVILHKKGDMMSISDLRVALLRILQEFRNGMLIIEDLRALFGNHIPLDVSGAITRNRHKNLDVIWHLQSVGRILPEYWENVNYVRFHKELNTIDNAKDKLPDVNLFKIAEYILNAQYAIGNTRHYIYIDNGLHKLIGNYTKEEMSVAIENYIKRNPKMINYLLVERNESNNRVHTFAEAVEIKKKEMFNQYYGNTIVINKSK
jgi:hypothetical protein